MLALKLTALPGLVLGTPTLIVVRVTGHLECFDVHFFRQKGMSLGDATEKQRGTQLWYGVIYACHFHSTIIELGEDQQKKLRTTDGLLSKCYLTNFFPLTVRCLLSTTTNTTIKMTCCTTWGIMVPSIQCPNVHVLPLGLARPLDRPYNSSNSFPSKLYFGSFPGPFHGHHLAQLHWPSARNTLMQRHQRPWYGCGQSNTLSISLISRRSDQERRAKYKNRPARPITTPTKTLPNWAAPRLEHGSFGV